VDQALIVHEIGERALPDGRANFESRSFNDTIRPR